MSTKPPTKFGSKTISMMGVSLCAVGAYILFASQDCVVPNQGFVCRVQLDIAAWRGERALNRVLPQILNDQREIHDSGLFNLRSRGGADAGSVLNSKLPIVLHDYESKVQTVCNRDKNPTAKISDSITKTINEAGTQWPQLAGKLDLSSVDLDWMKKLNTFDHWDVFKAVYQNPQCRSFTDKQYLDLTFNSMLWSKLRYLKGLKDGDLLSALREVRQFARILFTIDGNSWAWNIFILENRFLSQMPAEATPPGWARVSDERVNQMRRYFHSYKLGFALAMPASWLKKLYTNPYSSLGLCHAAIDEGMTIYPALDKFGSSMDAEKVRLFRKVRGFAEESCIGGTWYLKMKSQFFNSHYPFESKPDCEENCKESYVWLFSSLGSSPSTILKLYRE